MQTEVHTAEPLVPELSAFEFKMAIKKLKRHKPGIDHIPGEQFALKSIKLIIFRIRRIA
jgi:hypothetical protein